MKKEYSLEEIEERVHQQIDMWEKHFEHLTMDKHDVDFYHGLNSSLNVFLGSLGLPEYKNCFDNKEE